MGSHYPLAEQSTLGLFLLACCHLLILVIGKGQVSRDCQRVGVWLSMDYYAIFTHINLNTEVTGLMHSSNNISVEYTLSVLPALCFDLLLAIYLLYLLGVFLGCLIRPAS